MARYKTNTSQMSREYWPETECRRIEGSLPYHGSFDKDLKVRIRRSLISDVCSVVEPVDCTWAMVIWI